MSRPRRTGRLVRSFGVATALLCVVARPARAGSADKEAPAADKGGETVADARAHFKKGLELYQDGDFSAAMTELRRAYAIEPRYKLLYNLGQVAYELRDYVEAERYFTAYLEQGKGEIGADRRADVERDLERLHGRIARLRFETNHDGAKIALDDRALGAAPIADPVRVSAGTHHVTAELAGYATVHQDIDAVGGDELTVTLTFGARLNEPRAAERKVKQETGIEWPLWIGIASGAFAVAAGGVGYWATRDEADYKSALGRRTSRGELDGLADGARTKALVSDVLLGTAVVGGIVTVVLLATGTGSKSERSAVRAAAKPRMFRDGAFVF